MRNRYKLCRKALAERFFEGRDPGDIAEVQGMHFVSRHEGMTMRLDTTGGESLYYKPHDCRMSELLGDITELLFGKRLVPVQLLGDGFAFQESVEQRIPRTNEEKRSFYTWMGRLTAVFYALGSVDMHARNVCCCGDLPVVVDAETLLCPKAQGRTETWEFSIDYRDIFPDLRMFVEECRVLPLLSGLMQVSPLLPGGGCTPEGYEGSFLSGFEEGYRRVRENHEGIKGALDRYATAPLRYLFRRTAAYLFVQKAYRGASTPEEKAEVLKKLDAGLSEKGRASREGILAWERACIIKGKLPVFTALAGGRDLSGEHITDVLIPGFFERSPIEEAKRRIDSMGEGDLALQVAYIRASLKHADGWTFEREKEQPFEETAVLSPEAALEEVREAIGLLWEERIPLPQGGMLWHVPLVASESGGMLGFAEAFIGVALFAHACAESPLIVGEARAKAKEMAAAAFRSMAALGMYFLDRYPDSPSEQFLSRRFGGAFVLKDMLSGLLLAVRQCAPVDPETANRLLRGFESWKLEGTDEAAVAFLKQRCENVQTGGRAKTDILDGGNAGLAAMLLLDAESEDGAAETLERAGRILRQMVERKGKSGCYRVFLSGRKQYFQPGFFKGSTGIAWVLLRYAKLVHE